MLLADTFREFDRLLPAPQLAQYRNRGSQANAVAAALTVPNYHALRTFGLERLRDNSRGRRCVEGLHEAGESLEGGREGPRPGCPGPVELHPSDAPSVPVRVGGTTLAPGAPAMKQTATRVFHLTFTSCAPLNFIRQYLSEHGDDGELQLFQQTRCTYDWPYIDFLVGQPAHYERPHH